jgi:hypothetical protein
VAYNFKTALQTSNKLTKFLQDAGYYNVIISNVSESYSEYSVRYIVTCGICAKTETIKVGWDEATNNNQMLDVLCLKLTEFGKCHLHTTNPAQDAYPINTLNAYANKISNGNVTVDIVPTNNAGAISMWIQCHTCKYSQYIPVYNESVFTNYIPDIDLVAKNHLHQQPMYYQKKDLDILKTQTPWPGKITSTDDPQSIQPLYYKTYTGSSQNMAEKVVPMQGPITVSQAILKEVYKLSNFNVELQGKFIGATTDYDYRALCVNCHAEIKINHTALRLGDYQTTSTWTDITVFCTAHKHETTIALANERVGRKFK